MELNISKLNSSLNEVRTRIISKQLKFNTVTEFEDYIDIMVIQPIEREFIEKYGESENVADNIYEFREKTADFVDEMSERIEG